MKNSLLAHDEHAFSEDTTDESHTKTDVLRNRCTVLGLITISIILIVCLISQVYIYIICTQLQRDVDVNTKMISKFRERISPNYHSRPKYTNGKEYQQLYNTDAIEDTQNYDSKDNETENDIDHKLNNVKILKDNNVGIYSMEKGDESGEMVMDASLMISKGQLKRVRRSRERSGRDDRDQRRNGRGRQQDERPVQEKVRSVLHLELKPSQGGLEIRQGEKIRGWSLSDDDFNRDQDFADFSQDHVTINTAGIYLIYSQVTFQDHTGRWSYAITIQEPYRQERPFIKCLSTEWGIERGPDGSPPTTFSQCYSAAVAFVRSGEIVRIKSMYDTRSIHTDADMSFWGFVKLS